MIGVLALQGDYEKHTRILKEINISDDCYIGSKFDDSNEYARKRNQLGFSPGFDFKVSITS